MKRKFSALKKVITVVVSIVVTLFALEIVAGNFAPPVALIGESTRYHPDLGYELVPYGQDTYNVAGYNVKGERDFNPSIPKAKQVVVLGDSVPYGLGIRLWETYSKVLEQLLPDTEVHNLGVVGYNIQQSVGSYRAKAVDYKPNLVILNYCLNDAEEINSSKSVLQYSKLFRWLTTRIKSTRLRKEQSSVSGHQDWYQWITEKNWPTVVKELALIKKQTETDSTDLVLLLVPLLNDLPNQPYANIHQRLAKTAGKMGIDVLDLYDSFSSTATQAWYQIQKSDNIHPNQEGHRLIARKIGEFLEQKGWARKNVSDADLEKQIGKRVLNEDMGLAELGLRLAVKDKENKCNSIKPFQAALEKNPDNRLAKRWLRKLSNQCLKN